MDREREKSRAFVGRRPIETIACTRVRGPHDIAGGLRRSTGPSGRGRCLGDRPFGHAEESEQQVEELPPPRPVELPEDEGPPDGLTLSAAIDQLLAANYDLAAKFQDIPKGRADVITAGLRNDPVLFMSATAIPYGRYSEQRPGATQYDVTLVQSIDVSGKHKKAVRVARLMNQILEARYREAVRQEIDNLYISYIDVLEARAAGRSAQADLDRLTALVQTVGELVRKGKRPRTDLTRV